MAETANLQIKVSSTGVTKATDDLDKLTKASSGVEKASTKSQKAIGGIGRSAGQAGIQVQQFVGQIQGGQSAMLALSQQSADLGFVLGAPLLGAVVGISASLIGMATGLGQAQSATSLLDSAIDSLNGTITSNDGVLTFTKEIKELAKESETAARLLLATAESKSRQAGEAAATGIAEIFNDTFDVTFLQSSFDSLVKVAGTAEGVGYSLSQEYKEIGEQLGFTGSEARQAGVDILVSLRDMQEAISAGTPDATSKIIAFQESISALADSNQGEAREQILKFASGIEEYVKKAQKAARASELLKTALNSSPEDLTAVISKEDTKSLIEYLQVSQDAYKAIPDSIAQYENALSSLGNSLEYQIIAMEQGAKAAYEYQVAQRLGFESIEQAPEAIQNQIDKLFELKDAQSQLKETQEEITDSSLRMFESIQQNVVQGLGDATATALVDMQNLGEGVKGVLRGAIKQAISLLVQLGVQRLIQSQINIAATTAEATAAVSAGASIATAMAPAATATTIATGGANLTAASAQAPLFASAFAAMSSIASGSLSTVARASGGDLQGGQNSYIAENGLEVFAPNKNGRVFNKQDVQDMINGNKSSSSSVFNITTNQSFEDWFENGGSAKIERMLNRAGEL